MIPPSRAATPPPGRTVQKAPPRSKTLLVVFPAWSDLGSPRGDSEGRGGSQGDSTLPNSACDSSPEVGEEEEEGGSAAAAEAKMTYSVSYFNWSVSDESSEEDDDDDCRTVTLQLDRLKIRKSSRERNEQHRCQTLKPPS